MRKSIKRWLVPFFAAALSLAASAPAFAEEMVDVTVENVKGGYLKVYYREKDGLVYLPVGETSKVPKGTELRVTADNLDYRMSDTQYIRSELQFVSANGEELTSSSGSFYNEIKVEDDTTFSAKFSGHLQNLTPSESEEDEEVELLFVNGNNDFDWYTGTYKEGQFPAKQLTLYDFANEKNLGYTNIETIDIDSVWYENNDDGYDKPEELFQISNTGLLTASEPLEYGCYMINGRFYKEEEEHEFYLYVYVGASIDISIPMVRYEYNASRNNKRIMSIYGISIYGVDVSSTFSNMHTQYLNMPVKTSLAGHISSGLGSYSSLTGNFTSLNTKKLSEQIYSESYPCTSAYLMYSDYIPPIVKHLDESDILPEKVNKGWNQIGGAWYYYESEDPSSLLKNQWITDSDGTFWVGADGAMAKKTTIVVAGNTYVVDEYGHQVKGRTITINGVDYTTGADGIVISSKIHLATPSNAEAAVSQVDKVLDNLDTMESEDKVTAADMLTEALQDGKVAASDLTEEEIKKFEELYAAAYNDKEIIIETPNGATVIGAIMAAGLTSADFEDGSVTIEYKVEWLTSSSNCQPLSVKLYVNGESRNSLLAPITITADLPDTFIASYSNATHTFKVEKASDVTVDTEKGTITMTITTLGTFEIRATKKSTSSSSGSGSGSSSYISLGGGGGTARILANREKTGQWVLNHVGWWFQYDDGTWPAAEWVYLEWKDQHNWYYFNAEGYMVTGWLHWENNWYYLYPVADGNRGYMFTGWHDIGGKWYYFSTRNDGSAGAMAYNTTTPDGYQVDANGVWIQ